jgi:hypothetical protein
MHSRVGTPPSDGAGWEAKVRCIFHSTTELSNVWKVVLVVGPEPDETWGESCCVADALPVA